jgi:cysteine-rich repeat protein
MRSQYDAPAAMRRAAFLFATIVALLVVGGCTGDGEDSSGAIDSPAPDASTRLAPDTGNITDDTASDHDAAGPDTTSPAARPDAHADTEPAEPDGPVCGNGIRESGEDCDDGNDDPDDGCTNDCATTTHSTPVARDGEAALDIVVPPNASETLRAHAATLSTHLERITGATFAIVEGDGSKGIALGLPDQVDAPDLPDLTVSSPFEREDYLVRTHDKGIYLVGATELAVRHAVWDLLHRAGYRQYFPGDTWEIVPDRPNLELAADELESPAYLWRRLAFTYGSWEANEVRLEDWRRRNRANGAFRIRSGHAWQRVIMKNEETFENHPEYLGEDDQGNPTDKFCVTRPAVQKMAIDWAIQRLEDNPERDSVSMDPSDGGGWEGCPKDDRQLDSPSNRAVFLANKVAEALGEHFDDPKYVGMYAYNRHQYAPTIDIHERVVPNVANGFLKQGNSAEELFRSWTGAGANHMGLYDYYNVIGWTHDLPTEQKATSPGYVANSLGRFHEAGARFFNMETSDAWGPTGLGHWMAIRLGWELDEKSSDALLAELRDDFFSRAFGQAREPIEAFYNLVDRDSRPLMSEHLIGRMYRTLDRALQQTDNPDVVERIHDLALYTRYVELYRDYKYADAANRQNRFEQFIRFTYRIRDTHMVHSLARYRFVANRDDEVSIPEGAAWDVDLANNPWKSSESFTPKQIRGFVDRGSDDHALRDFQPREYNRDLIPAAPLALDDSMQARIGARGARHDDLSDDQVTEQFDEFYRARSTRGQGTVALYTWIPEGAAAPFDLQFSVSAENIHGTEAGGQLPVDLFAPNPAGPANRLGSAELPVDRSVHTSTLEAPTSGLYRLDFGGDGRFFDLRMRHDDPPLHKTYEMSPEQWVQGIGRSSYLFYVPEGTDTIGGYATPGTDFGDHIERPDGKVAFAFSELDRPGYFSVDVPDGADGKLWRLDNLPSRKRFLMTVPPQVAESPDQLLLPRQVVQADHQQ